MRFIALFLLTFPTLSAQSPAPYTFSGGFKLGAPINDPASANYLNYIQSRWTGGPTVEFHLPYRFSLEFDALYRTDRSNFNSTIQLSPNVNAYAISVNNKAHAWDLPLLLKYRVQVAGLHPFISGGMLLTRSTTDRTVSYGCTGTQGSCLPADYPFQRPLGGTNTSTSTHRGVAAGAGLEFKTRLVTITPEFRYSRSLQGYPQDNRFTGMVGFTFGKRR